MKIAIYAFDICPVYREGKRGEHEIEVSPGLWREYVEALDRFQILLTEIEQLVYAQAVARREGHENPSLASRLPSVSTSTSPRLTLRRDSGSLSSTRRAMLPRELQKLSRKRAQTSNKPVFSICGTQNGQNSF